MTSPTLSSGPTAPALTPQTLFNPDTMIDVSAYGALGDGSDATSAIQRAEAAADESGKALFFDPGTYEISSTFWLQSNEKWLSSPGTVTLQAASDLPTMFAIDGAPPTGDQAAVPIQNVTLSGLTLEGAAGAVGVHAPLVVSWIASGLTIENTTVEHVRGVGLLLSNTADTTVSDSQFLDIGNAPLATGNLDDASQGIAFCGNADLQSSDNTVIGCTFAAIGLDAISATQQQNLTISNNGMTALNVLAGWNQWPQGAAGIYLDEDSNALLSDNTIQGASGNGIDVIHVSNLVISSNTVDASNEAGIAICDVCSASLISNVSTNNNQLHDHFIHTGGITIAGDESDPSSNVLLSGNILSDNQQTHTQDWGLQIDPGTPISNLSLDGTNVFTGNVDGGMNFTPAGLDVSPSVNCFEAATRLLTINGERRICDLATGDVLILACEPWAAPVVKLVSHEVRPSMHSQPETVTPIRIRRHAFGPGRPTSDLYVSPEHGIFCNGALVPAKHLVNGKTVLHARARALHQYWHVELPKHGLVFAHGLPTESHLDLARLISVSNTVRGDDDDVKNRLWEAHACAPQVRSGPALDTIRRQLWNFALAGGWRALTDPQPEIMAKSGPLKVEREHGMLTCRLGGGCAAVRIVSETFIPSDVPARDSLDRRRLGVAVKQVLFDGTVQDLAAFTGPGWHHPEPGWRWTGGDAVLGVAGVSTLSIVTAAWSQTLVKRRPSSRWRASTSPTGRDAAGFNIPKAIRSTTVRNLRTAL